MSALKPITGPITALLPLDCLPKVLGYCNIEESACFGRVNKAFAAVLRNEASAGEVLLEQITKCTCLTSMKDLWKQAERLEWTIADVLKRYHLKKVDFSQNAVSPGDITELLDALKEVHCDISYLDFGKNVLTQGQINDFLKYCPNLQHIALSCSDIDTYLSIFEYFSNNNANTLIHFNVNYLQTIDLGEEYLIDNFILNQKRLEYFAFPLLHDTSLNRIISRLSDECPNLGNLSLAYGYGDYDLRDAVLDFAERRPHLHTVDFNDMGHKFPEFTVELIGQLGKVCKNIKSIRFDLYKALEHHKIDDTVIEAAFDAFPEIENFFLRNAPLVTDRSFAQFSHRWPKLKDLHLACCRSASVSAVYSILRDCKQLKTVVLHEWEQGKYVAQIYLQLRFLNRKLQEKNLSGIDFFKECKKLAPDLLAMIERFIWINDGTPSIDRYGERTLQDNPEKLKACTKPFISLQGRHLLEQLEAIHLGVLPYVLTCDKIMPIENFLCSPGDPYGLYDLIDRRIRNEVEYKIFEAKLVKRNLYGVDVYDFAPWAKITHIALPILRRHLIDLRINIAPIGQTLSREKLEAFLALLKDPEITQSQLDERYRYFDLALQKRLEHTLSAPRDLAVQRMEKLIHSFRPFDHAHSLPSAVTSYIFSFADFKTMHSLSHVSKAFNQAVKAAKIQKKKHTANDFIQELYGVIAAFVGGPRRSYEELLQIVRTLSEQERVPLIASVERAFAGIQTLDFSRADTDAEAILILQLLGKRAGQIVSLNFSKTLINAENFALLRKLCPNLVELHLNPSEVTDKGLAQIVQGCPNLTSINLSGCRLITDAGIRTIADHYPQLISLDISNCKVKDETIVLYIAERCRELRYLQPPSDTPSEIYLALVKFYPNITDIEGIKIERYKRVLKYSPVSPFGKLFAAILFRKPREEIEKLFEAQDASFDKARFLALIQKGDKDISLSNATYDSMKRSVAQLALELSVAFAEVSHEKLDRLLAQFYNLLKLPRPINNNYPLDEAFNTNYICLADAFNIISNEAALVGVFLKKDGNECGKS